MQLPQPCTTDPGSLSEAALAGAGIIRLPQTLGHAIEAFQADEGELGGGRRQPVTAGGSQRAVDWQPISGGWAGQRWVNRAVVDERRAGLVPRDFG